MVNNLLIPILGHREAGAAPLGDTWLAIRAFPPLGAQVVTFDKSEALPPEAILAMAWTPPNLRAPLSMALQLDRRLARIVARTSEPMLGQMRLAWWRDALSNKLADRPRGDAVLDGIGAHWAGREAALIAMVDAWEVLVTAERIGYEDAKSFGIGRGEFFTAIAGLEDVSNRDRLAAAGYRWAMADAAVAVSQPDERDVLIQVGLARAHLNESFPRSLRGLAVLEALALRALRGGGQPLMAGRGAALTALRAAIFLS